MLFVVFIDRMKS